MDVTKPWFFNGLEYVYGEHFLEHLSLEGAIAFLDKILFYKFKNLFVWFSVK